jgi:UTP:GlnB (protein PII) uridylyltransferase
MVYQKPTHTNLYLNPGSHHHPSSNQAVLAALVLRARALCGRESLHDEFDVLEDHFQEKWVQPKADTMCCQSTCEDL